MNPGSITVSDIGGWFMTDEREEVKVLGVMGSLIRCETSHGIVLIPIFDIDRPIRKVEKPVVPRIQKVEKKQKANPYVKAIVGVDKDGKEHRFPSLSDAARNMGVSPATICKAVQESWRTAAGMHWRYL